MLPSPVFLRSEAAWQQAPPSAEPQVWVPDRSSKPGCVHSNDNGSCCQGGWTRSLGAIWYHNWEIIVEEGEKEREDVRGGGACSEVRN